MSDDGIFVHQFELGPWDNFIYLIGDKATRKAAVVDPAWHADTIFAEADRLGVQIEHILCTHSHFDHVDQVDALLEKLDIPVHMLAEEVDFASFACENLERRSPGDRLAIGEHCEITFMHTPGHTPGSTTYRLRDSIVTGDTLFINGCGRCDFVGGDPPTMFKTLNEICDRLPGDTVVYPGHNYGNTPTATLADQLEHNPFLVQPTLEDFVTHRMDGKTAGSPLPPRPDWTP